jgi:hypothetical protein
MSMLLSLPSSFVAERICSFGRSEIALLALNGMLCLLSAHNLFLVVGKYEEEVKTFQLLLTD